MAPVFEGSLRGAGRRFGIVVARTNDFVTRPLLEGALATLKKHGVAESDIDILWVPGAFELGPAAYRLVATREPHAVIALGAVIKGETDHYQFICDAAARGVEAAARETGTPVTFGVITAHTTADAEARAGGARGNLGAKSAEAALELADAYARLDDATAAEPVPFTGVVAAEAAPIPRHEPDDDDAE
jgi:6,7-dimethyl-8-ribityllumazine synthase